MNALSLLAALRLAITGPRYLRPTLAQIAAQSDRAPAPRPRPAAELTAAQWFARLEDYLPRAFLYAYACDLDQLRIVSGCSPAEAASYARTYLGAPALAAKGTIYAPPAHE